MQAYKALFHSILVAIGCSKLRMPGLPGTPLGSDYFREKVETTLSRKVGHVKRGRPRRHKSEAGKVKGIKGSDPLIKFFLSKRLRS